MSLKKNKKKSIQSAIEQIEKQFGKESIIKLKNNKYSNIETISTGSVSLDIALGIGGLPMGRIIEIYGPESSGKTTLALEIISSAQKKNKICIFIDAEHALDPIYAKKIGVNLEELLCSQPNNGEQALEICNSLAKSQNIDVIIVDSVAALTPKTEIEGEIGDSHLGLAARMMSQAMRKLARNINKSNILLIFINQIRMKIGILFGNPETTTGGNALKFYSSVRLDIRKIGTIKYKEEIIGNETRVKVVKNKLSAPFKKAEFQILYSEGINEYEEILNIGVKKNIIQKNGSWYNFNNIKLGQGKKTSSTFLKKNLEILKKIKNKIEKIYFPFKNNN